MSLTGNDIRNALGAVGAIGGQMTSFDNLADGANSALLTAPAGLTVQGAAAFLATQAQESAFFRTTEEYAKNGRYAPYIGRTFDQLTWKSNYAAFGLWCYQNRLISDPNYFVNNPRALAEYKWAWLGGIWFFRQNGLWKYANAGNFLAVSQGVNGGNGTIGSRFVPAGYSVRLKMYNSFLSLGNRLLPSGHHDTTPQHADTGQDLNLWLSVADVKKIQKILNVTADGVAGPKTVKALEIKAGYASVADGKLPKGGSATVKKIQARINQQIGTKLVVDGILGSATGKALSTYLAKGGKFTNLANQSLTVKKTTSPAANKKLTIDGIAGASTIKALQKYVGTTQDGVVSGQDGGWKKVLPTANWTTVDWQPAGKGYGSKAIAALQKKLGIRDADGVVGLGTAKAIQKWVGVTQDGILGVNSVKALQKKLNTLA